MIRNIVILDSAKEDFKNIKKYLKNEFGDNTWNAINEEFKNAIKLIKDNPHAGTYIDELKDIGIVDVKSTLVRQTRIVYEFDDQLVWIHMFIATKRDFTTHLFQRLLSAKI